MARTPLNKVLEFNLEAPAQDDDQSGPPLLEPFDFDGELPAGPREEVKSRIEVVLTRLSRAIIETGHELIAIRELIIKHGKRGSWSRFLASGLPFSESAARNYIKAAELKNSATVAEIELLKPTAMYATARASEEVRREVETSLHDDVVLTPAEIKNIVKEHEAQSTGHNKEVPEQDNTASTSETESPRPASSPQEARINSAHATNDKRETAARELLAQLREQFADSDIRRLNDLWREAGFNTIQQILDGSASMKSRGSAHC